MAGIDTSSNLVDASNYIISVNVSGSLEWTKWNSHTYINTSGNALHYAELYYINTLTTGSYFISDSSGDLAYNLDSNAVLLETDLSANQGDLFTYVGKGVGNNWAKVSVRLPETASITTQMIADNAITSAKIAEGAITADIFGNNSIGGEKLKNDTITGEKIVDNAITTAKLGTGAVDTDKIKDDSVTSVKLADGVVGSDAIGVGSIITEKIADSAITTVKLDDTAITTAKIADESITIAKLAPGVILHGPTGAQGATGASRCWCYYRCNGAQGAGLVLKE